MCDSGPRLLACTYRAKNGAAMACKRAKRREQEVRPSVNTKFLGKRNPRQIRFFPLPDFLIDNAETCLADHATKIRNSHSVERNQWVVDPSPALGGEAQEIVGRYLTIEISILVAEINPMAHDSTRTKDAPELFKVFMNEIGVKIFEDSI